jgi:uncharacterized membrane protein
MDWQSLRWYDYLSLCVSLIGVAVILWGVVLGAIEFVRAQFLSFSRRQPVPLESMRYDVGRYILLGLEFFIAADIIHTVVQPTLEEVAVLAGIVIIRTFISYFLNREMDKFGHLQK